MDMCPGIHPHAERSTREEASCPARGRGLGPQPMGRWDGPAPPRGASDQPSPATLPPPAFPYLPSPFPEVSLGPPQEGVERRLFLRREGLSSASKHSISRAWAVQAAKRSGGALSHCFGVSLWANESFRSHEQTPQAGLSRLGNLVDLVTGVGILSLHGAGSAGAGAVVPREPLPTKHSTES